jgi:hypothetical protein
MTVCELRAAKTLINSPDDLLQKIDKFQHIHCGAILQRVYTLLIFFALFYLAEVCIKIMDVRISSRNILVSKSDHFAAQTILDLSGS